MRKLGDNKPESQSLSLWVRETAQWLGNCQCQCLTKQNLWSPEGGSGTKSFIQLGRPPVVWQSGGLRGMEQHLGVWRLTVSVVSLKSTPVIPKFLAPG